MSNIIEFPGGENEAIEMVRQKIEAEFNSPAMTEYVTSVFKERYDRYHNQEKYSVKIPVQLPPGVGAGEDVYVDNLELSRLIHGLIDKMLIEMMSLDISLWLAEHPEATLHLVEQQPVVFIVIRERSAQPA